MKRYYGLLIILLVIGFAAVSSTLVINGTINIGFNEEKFDKNIVFTYTNTMNGKAEIEESGKKITFNTNIIKNLDEQAILDFDIANKSNQYDATVSINCGLSTSDEEYKEFIQIEQSLDDTFELNAGQTVSGRLKMTLIKVYDAVETLDINYECILKATPGEKEKSVDYEPLVHEYKEIILNGAEPVLDSTLLKTVTLSPTNEKKLIPVIIDDSGIVKKADVNDKWYSYEDKKWANAVILVDGAEDPEVGSEIGEDQIESYFVWIPKFKYKLFTMANKIGDISPRTIEIKFGTENTINNENECVAPASGENGECLVGKWMTHPAFTSFGDISGIWVGKFETGYKTATDKYSIPYDTEDLSNLIIKPNQYSWINNEIKYNYNMSYNYARNLESHMMKNTEWGAVAYLSHSKYGINGEIRINNNSDFKTGYAALDSVSESGNTDDYWALYNTSTGYKASTTGNITGIYDMAGGAFEQMASYNDLGENGYNESDGRMGSSQFLYSEVAGLNEKYFDKYKASNFYKSFVNRILGDATGELGFNEYSSEGWYSSTNIFIDEYDPWFTRGGFYDNGNIFNSAGTGNETWGDTYEETFRIVLAL